jgi:hypothetical protein
VRTANAASHLALGAGVNAEVSQGSTYRHELHRLERGSALDWLHGKGGLGPEERVTVQWLEEECLGKEPVQEGQ